MKLLTILYHLVTPILLILSVVSLINVLVFTERRLHHLDAVAADYLESTGREVTYPPMPLRTVGEVLFGFGRDSQ